MGPADESSLEARLGLRGRVAVVLGGAGGLGRGCVKELGGAGMRLAIADRDADGLRRTTEELADDGVEVVWREMDCRDPDALDGFFSYVDERLGSLHTLVNVVGGTFHQYFEHSSPKGWEALIRTNFTWLLKASQLAIPRMRASGGGSIVNMGSIEGHRGAPGYAVYAGLKAAVANFGRSLAVELASDAIRVNTVSPDLVPTEGMTNLVDLSGGGTDIDERERSRAIQISIPAGRTGVVDDVSGCVLFLVSDLSRYVTGTTVHPDGGTYASSGWFNWPEIGYHNIVPDERTSRSSPVDRSQ